MKFSLIALMLLVSMELWAQHDHRIRINDTVMEIAMDQEYRIMLDGKAITFELTVNDTLLYDDDLFSFEYPKDYKVSKLQIEEGIEQIIIVTAEGSGILIQKYSTLNPTMLNEMMLTEITKESLNYGFRMKRNDYSRKLKSGQTLEVDKAILKYKEDTNIYEVASIGNKDEGILIVTMVMDESMGQQGSMIIDLMWNSLIYK